MRRVMRRVMISGVGRFNLAFKFLFYGCPLMLFKFLFYGWSVMLLPVKARGVAPRPTGINMGFNDKYLRAQGLLCLRDIWISLHYGVS